MPAILNSLFHKVASQYHEQSYRGGGWGMMGSHKVEGPFDAKTVLWPNGFNSGCFQLHMSQNVARTMQSCGDSLLAVFWPGKLGANYRPPEHRWMPDRPVKEASVKADQ